MNIEEISDKIGSTIEELLQEIYGKEMGFVIGIFEFDKEGLATYVTNAEKDGLVESLREMANRVEIEFPNVIGTA